MTSRRSPEANAFGELADEHLVRAMRIHQRLADFLDSPERARAPGRKRSPPTDSPGETKAPPIRHRFRITVEIEELG